MTVILLKLWTKFNVNHWLTQNSTSLSTQVHLRLCISLEFYDRLSHKKLNICTVSFSIWPRSRLLPLGNQQKHWLSPLYCGYRLDCVSCSLTNYPCQHEWDRLETVRSSEWLSVGVGHQHCNYTLLFFNK